MQLQTPQRLISIHAVELFAAGIGGFCDQGLCMPALLNAASCRPKVETVYSTIAATSPSSATSQRMGSAL